MQDKICIPVGPEEIPELSAMATRIVREHFDPLIGKAQNDYMLARFQTVEAIKGHFEEGYRYYWVMDEEEKGGFLAFYPKGSYMYLSKFYVEKHRRGKHLARKMLQTVIDSAKEEGLKSIRLNVNRGNTEVIQKYQSLGFNIIREEKNDIGSGFYMDDYVLEYVI